MQKLSSSRTCATIYPIVCILSLIVSVSSYADDSRGRLADGRAYRKDNAGNTMVDYIAELELEVDSLRRQVQGLEGERDSVELKMSSRTPEGCQIPLKEKNLVGSDTKQVSALSCPKCEEHVCPSIQKDCSSEIASAGESCSINIEKVNQAYIARLKTSNVQVEMKDREIERLMASLEQSNQQVKSIQASRNVAQKSEVVRDCSKEIELSLAKVRTPQIANLQKLINEKDQAISLLLNENDQLKIKQAEQNNLIRASYVPPVEKKLDLKPAQEVPQQIANQNDPLQSARGVVLSEINKVATAISDRDTLYSSYKQKPNMVSFTPGTAKSEKGRTIQDLKNEIKDALTMRDLSLVRREVSEIKTKIDFDIGMMRRLMAFKQ